MNVSSQVSLYQLLYLELLNFEPAHAIERLKHLEPDLARSGFDKTRTTCGNHSQAPQRTATLLETKLSRSEFT